jgi:5'-nucleotidase
MMKILLTNDDGIDAPGIQALVNALKDDYELYVCAPMQQRSGYSHAVTYFSGDNKAEERNIEGVKKAWAVDGTPADCAYYGIYAMNDTKPDLVISGINQGENLSYDVLYSGTIGAAEEGLVAGIPSMAISLCSFTDSHFEISADIAKRMIPGYMSDEERTKYILSINVPAGTYNDIKGYKVCGVQDGRTYIKEVVQNRQQDGSILLHVENNPHHQQDSSCVHEDDAAVRSGYVALTPICIAPYRPERLHILKQIFSKAEEM